jgi:hypothetical protein
MMPKSQASIQKMLDDKCKFAPKDGKCPKCGRNIYSKIIVKEDMAMITSCCYCNHSFVN